MQAAADWTSVLINMNKDSVEASLNQLHEGTVGQLNADFDSTIEPYRKLVQTLQAHTTGQIDSVAVESIHHAQPGPNGAPPPQQQQPELSASAARTDTVMVVATSISENAGADKPQTVRWTLRLDVSDVDGKLAHLAAGADPMRNRWRVLAFDILAPVAAVAALVYIGIALAWPLWWVSVCSVLCLLIVEGVDRQLRLARRDFGHRRHRRRRSRVAAGCRRGGDHGFGGRGSGRIPAVDGARPHAARRQRRGGRHRQQHLGGLRDVHATKPHRVESTVPRR